MNPVEDLRLNKKVRNVKRKQVFVNLCFRGLSQGIEMHQHRPYSETFHEQLLSRKGNGP